MLIRGIIICATSVQCLGLVYPHVSACLGSMLQILTHIDVMEEVPTQILLNPALQHVPIAQDPNSLLQRRTDGRRESVQMAMDGRDPSAGNSAGI